MRTQLALAKTQDSEAIFQAHNYLLQQRFEIVTPKSCNCGDTTHFHLKCQGSFLQDRTMPMLHVENASVIQKSSLLWPASLGAPEPWWPIMCHLTYEQTLVMCHHSQVIMSQATVTLPRHPAAITTPPTSLRLTHYSLMKCIIVSWFLFTQN